MSDIYDAMASLERFCVKCGKDFICRDCEHWAYRTGSGRDAKLFCSWHCLREWEKEKASSGISRVKRRQRVINTILKNPELKPAAITKMLGEEPKMVWYWYYKVNDRNEQAKREAIG